ncbi:MAG: FtsX-like permease family protein [Aerococcus sp.]|nr:FtsX-like permease family protein [Aerococcus sp.]
MNGKLSWKMAFRQLNSQRHLNLPFVLSSGLMFAMEYIILSLLMNQYVLERHANLIIIVRMGAVICTLLTAVFVFYANNFYQKQRYEEMALYSILGLEKRHIRSILHKEKIVQTLMMAVLAIGGGHLFGSMVFIGLNKLMKSTGTTLMDYPFRWQIALTAFVVIFVIMGGCYVMNSWQINRMKPIELMQQQHTGEKEPKSKWLIALIGVALISVGYYIALTNTQNVMSALTNILGAVFLVVLGTYAVYMGLSIIILKLLKKKKGYYYQPTHFFSVSGMLYRMKANAISLASIAVLCTGILTTMGLTVSLYSGMESQANSVMSTDYQLDGDSPDQLKKALDDIQKTVTTKDEQLVQNIQVGTFMEGNQLLPLDPKMTKDGEMDISKAYYIQAQNITNFNQAHAQNFKLADDEILMTATTPAMRSVKQLTINEKTYRVRSLDDSYLSSQLAIDYFYVVLPDSVSLKDLGHYYYLYDARTKEKSDAGVNEALQFNVVGDKEALLKQKQSLLDNYHVELSSRTDILKLIYELNGGLLFLGIVVGVVLAIGVGLMLYYKQISEGMQDRENFRIMAQVGLPDRLIHKTIQQQILTVFLLPLITALIHISIAFGVLRSLLRLLAVRDMTMVLMCFGLVTLGFVVIYGIFFMLTQRTYYRLVHPKTLSQRTE